MSIEQVLQERKASGSRAHGVDDAGYDNLGEGWRVTCLCGWVSCPATGLGGAGEEFDEHLKEWQ